MVPKTAEQTAPVELEENKYELMVIIKPEMSDEDMGKELDVIRKQITDIKGEIYHEDLWNVRNLAYLIKKFDRGYYAVFYFTADPEKIKDIEKNFILNQKILRHFMVKNPKGYVIKPLSELELTDEERKRQRTERAAEKGTRRGGQPVRQPIKKTAEKPVEKTAEKPVEKTAEKSVKEEKAESVAEAKAPVKEIKPKKEEKPMDISDLDSKLSSILDDSDLNMKL